MVIKQENAFEVESLVRVYYKDGAFSEPFNKVTFYNMDATRFAQLDVNGLVPLPPRTPITFDCHSLGVNVSNMNVHLNGTTAGVVVYFTKYTGFIWAKE